MIWSIIYQRTAIQFVRIINQYNRGEINIEKTIELLNKLRDEHMRDINNALRMGVEDIGGNLNEHVR